MLVGYSSSWELGEFCRNKKFCVNEEIDLIIRTGFRQRISDFCPYQSRYAELFFLNKFWPDFSLEDLERILSEFRNRVRTFGG